MSCHGCAKGFGFLTKEHGCEKCGFSFCSKCLVSKTCKSCSSVKAPSVAPIPPVVLQERLEKLENPNRNPIVVYADSTRMSNLKRGLSLEDQELVNRLSKLKNEIRELKGDVPSQAEIEERLAKLKGIDPQVYRKPAVFTKPKSNVDEATDLINQMREEVAIDRQSDEFPSNSLHFNFEQIEDNVDILLQNEAMVIEAEAKLALEGLKKDQEIQERLRKLKLDRESRKQDEVAKDVDDSEDEDKQAARIIDRVLAEDRLELEDEGISADGGAEEELPWCEICNEDAQLRCLGCDKDLYCRRCWKETHQDAELKQHRIENYKAPK